jgi:hypothetical protein
MTWEQDVYSTVAASIGYDAENNEMYVTWRRSGKRSIYSGVPEALARDVANAGSVGTMLNNEIKPYYEHRYG